MVEIIIMIKCIYCTNVKLFHLNIHQVKLTQGNQQELIIIQKKSNIDAVSVATTSLPPLIDNGRMSVRLESAYFK